MIFCQILADNPCLSQMMENYNQTGGNYIAAMEVDDSQIPTKGIISPGARNGRRVEIKGMVEKPKLADAPSNLAVLGRYILQPEIFPILETIGQGSGGEIQLTDGLARLLQSQAFYGYAVEGVWHDCGNKLGWLEANIAFALARPELREPMQRILANYSRQTAGSDQAA